MTCASTGAALICGIAMNPKTAVVKAAKIVIRIVVFVRQGLLEFGYVEGKKLSIEYRWGDGNFDRIPGMAAELVHLNVDVIISGNTAALLALLPRCSSLFPVLTWRKCDARLGPSAQGAKCHDVSSTL
jgi:ABC-type uncharacterized transport system substrate-binding protein